MTTLQNEYDENQEIIALTSSMVHKYYCENDVESVIALMDTQLTWIGAAEQEYAVGREIIAETFRRFAGQVPKCIITEEEYHVVPLGEDAYLCSGRMWISTDPTTQISLRVHQRISTVFCRRGNDWRCCHIHISNPYGEMTEEDVGFPTKMAKQSYEYLQKQIEIQEARLAAQTDLLRRMSYEDMLTGLHNKNKFLELVNAPCIKPKEGIGLACFDLNGLKEVNDQQGHSAGDELLCVVAQQIQLVFPQKGYRVGGDEFIVIDDTREDIFLAGVQAVQRELSRKGINCAVGCSWRDIRNSNIKDQYDEADKLMYQEKRRFHSEEAKNQTKDHV